MTEFGYTYPIAPRLGDIDPNEHVNNTVYPNYMEEARATYFRELFDHDWRESSVVIATMTVDFLSPIHFDDDVEVDVRVSEVGTASWTVEYRVRAIDPNSGADRVAAEGSSVQVAWDREAETSQDLPDAWRERLEGELVTPAE